jgi:hypothetical protein
LPDDYIIALLQARDGTIWIGTRGGLASIAGGKITRFTTSDGLASNYIRSLYEDADRVLWIGTYDGGLTRLKDGKFARITKNQGLSSDGVFCILEDDRGWLWMNSNQGIYRARKQDLHDVADGRVASLTSIAYTREDGLLNVEGNGGRQPAGIRARDGTLWFPTAQGIATVNPATVSTNQLPPRVLIEGVLIDRTQIPPETLQSALHGGPRIVLQPNQNNLEIAYTGISFVNAAQVKFKYKLEGVDPDWNEVGTRRAAYYSYLRPGTFTFRVMAANRDGFWSATPAAMTITVLPPFYKTASFLAACAVAMLALLWAAHRFRMRQVRHAFEMTLEARVGERTRIARELHDTLLQGFHGLLLRFQTVSHPLARPRTRGQGTAGQRHRPGGRVDHRRPRCGAGTAHFNARRQRSRRGHQNPGRRAGPHRSSPCQLPRRRRGDAARSASDPARRDLQDRRGGAAERLPPRGGRPHRGRASLRPRRVADARARRRQGN